VREQHRLRDGDAGLFGDEAAEVLVVRAEPERVVDDLRALERRLLQERSVERDLVADAVEDRSSPPLHPQHHSP
jgi:hypothetical protein